MRNEEVKTQIFRIGELARVKNVRKHPFIFNGTINTAPRMLAKYDYDTLEICNDSNEDVFFSLDGGQVYQLAKKLEMRIWDRCTFSEQFWVYCGANTAAIRVTLWRQEI